MSLLSKSADERPRTALAVLNVLTELDLTQDYRLKRSPLAQEIMEGETLDSESVEVAATPVMRPADGGAETQTELVDSASELSLEGHGSPTRIWLAALLILAMLAVGLVIASMDKTSAVPATAATSRVDASLSARSVRKSVLDAPITKDAMVVVEPSAPSAPAALAPSDAAQSPRDMVGRTAEAEAIVVSWHVDSRPVGATVTIPAMKRALGQTPLRSNMSREVLKRLEMDGILTLEFKRFGFRTRSRVIRWKDVSDNRLAMTVQLKRRKKPRRSTPTTKPTPAPKKKKLLPALRTQ